MRPGGIFAGMDGDCLVALYNTHGLIAKVNANGRVEYIDVKEPDQAFLHASASSQICKSQRYDGKFDLMLTGSSQDFQGSLSAFNFFVEAEQKDLVVILTNFDMKTGTWEKKHTFYAPTQNSWFHRGWVLQDSASDAQEMVVTELGADRVFFIWHDKTWKTEKKH
jgi:hypothetical protein